MILKVIVVKIRSSFLLAWIYGYGCDVQVEKFWKVNPRTILRADFQEKVKIYIPSGPPWTGPFLLQTFLEISAMDL